MERRPAILELRIPATAIAIRKVAVQKRINSPGKPGRID
jgi:hypothetical protein